MRRIVIVALASAVFMAPQLVVGQAQAAPSGSQIRTTVSNFIAAVFGALPANQTKAVCAQWKQEPKDVTASLLKNMKPQLGIGVSDWNAGVAMGLKQFCTKGSSRETAIAAIGGLLEIAFTSKSPSQVRAVCTAYAKQPAKMIATAVTEFGDLGDGFPTDVLKAGAKQALDATCG